MSDRLPQGPVNPFKLAEKQAAFEGPMALSPMQRLAERMPALASAATVSIRFLRDPEGWFIAEGQIDAPLTLTCERCCEAMPYHLQTDFSWVMLRSEQVQAPKAYDPILVEQELVDLVALVEDEILLSLPQFAYHDETDCALPPAVVNAGEAAQLASPEDKPNPFAVLADWKSK